MTPEAQRIAIAEACGWKFPKSMEYFFGRNPDIGVMPNVAGTAKLPDYLNDLNAMHEAEKVLKPWHCCIWIKHLSKACNGLNPPQNQINEAEAMVLTHSTAAQRAEAFLKTLGLWKE